MRSSNLLSTFTVNRYGKRFKCQTISTATVGRNLKSKGNLTILDTTKSISFNANITITDSKITINSEDFAVNRTNWGLSYNTEGTVGVPTNYLIANDIGFTINITK